MPKILSIEERKLRENMIVQGLSYSEIARRLGLNPSTVSVHARRYNLRRYRRTPKDKAEIIRVQLNAGDSVKDIAESLNMSTNGVYHLIRRFNLRE